MRRVSVSDRKGGMAPVYQRFSPWVACKWGGHEICYKCNGACTGRQPLLDHDDARRPVFAAKPDIPCPQETRNMPTRHTYRAASHRRGTLQFGVVVATLSMCVSACLACVWTNPATQVCHNNSSTCNTEPCARGCRICCNHFATPPDTPDFACWATQCTGLPVTCASGSDDPGGFQPTEPGGPE